LLHPDSARNRLAGIGLISLCFLLFTLLDGTAKWLVTAMNFWALHALAHRYAPSSASGLYLFAREKNLSVARERSGR
jgi:hypothetical protein